MKGLCAHYSDCEVEPPPAAAGGGEQRALQARGDPVLCYGDLLAHQHLDLAPALRFGPDRVPQNTGSQSNYLLKVQPLKYSTSLYLNYSQPQKSTRTLANVLHHTVLFLILARSVLGFHFQM